jgi:photosystem II stability/assembly factor-like uncharacterized protein
MRSRVALFSLSYLAACSPANPNPEVAKPTQLVTDAGPSGPSFATPSKWALTFSQRWRSVASMELDSGSSLHAGDGGERWIESASGNQEGAQMLAPERIVGIQKAEGMYRFVGASGVVYSAREPLGSLTKAGSPVEGARQVAVGKTAIVVVDGKGDLQRSIDGGRTWSKVEIPGREGVIVDVAMLGDKGILVVAPQRFYGTKDDGVTWTVAKSPGIGVQSVVARDGALWVDGAEENMRFDAAWNTFSSAASGTARPPVHKYTKATAPVTISRIDGRRAIQITGNGTERVWSIAVGDMGALGKPRKVDELDGCEIVDAAMRGDDVIVSCDARGTVSGGIDKDASGPINRYSYGKTSGSPDGGSLGWVTKIVKSTDSGRTFRDEATIEGGIPQRADVGVAIGPDDFIYVGRRCAQGYNPACIGARVRASKSAGFSELPGEDDTTTNSGHVRFATSGGHSSAYSIGMRDNEPFLFRWKSGSAMPEPVGRIAQNIDAQSATISLDDDGVVRGFARSGKDAIVFSYKEGGTIATSTLQIPAAHGAFAGQHGFVVTNAVGTTDAKAYESLDGGKTWGSVGAPAFIATIDACSSFGCVTDRGFRWGWDAPTSTSPDAGTNAQKPAAKALYAKPLRCSAKDKWVELGGGNLPNVSSVDHGATRWLLPTRDKDGKITLLTSKRGDPTTKTSPTQLMGVPPGAPKFGSGTTLHVQDGGVVALRYVYSRDRTKSSGRYNPVDASLVWWRDGGKVARATVNKNPAFRVNKDPQGGYDRDQQPMYSELPELVSLSPKGVYFHPGSYFEEDDSGNDPKRVPLLLLGDDGKTTKTPIPEGLENAGGSGVMASVDGTNMLLGRNPESWTTTSLTDGKRTFFSVLGGLGDDDGSVDLVTINGKASFAATLRDPARAWLIGLKPETDLGAVTAIATQKSLGDVPKACDGAPATDPNAYRVNAPWVLGSRRPVIVDSDGTSIVMATDRAEIRGTTSSGGEACVAAFDALVPSQDGDHDFGALVFTDDLAHSLLFRADTSVWPAPVAVRTMECQYQSGPLPEELEGTEGFVPDDRHSAITRKRY